MMVYTGWLVAAILLAISIRRKLSGKYVISLTKEQVDEVLLGLFYLDSKEHYGKSTATAIGIQMPTQYLKRYALEIENELREPRLYKEPE